MPYSIKTKDGIVITNIPDSITSTDQALKDLVMSLRSAGKTGSFEFSTPTQTAVPNPATTPTTVPPTTTTTIPPEATPTETTPVDQTSLLGLMGGAVRGAGPVAMGAALGAAMGAPIGGVGAVPGAIAGAGAAGLTMLVADPIVSAINNMLGTKYKMPTEALEDLFTRLGVAEPSTAAERVVQAASSGAAGGLSSVALGQALQAGAGLGASAAKGIGATLASGPVQQVTGSLGAGVGSQTAKELGGGPAIQAGAGLIGSVLGSAAGGIKLGAPPTGPVAEAEQAGVRLMTSDVKTPDNFATKWLRGIGEKLPVVGTGGMRAAQQTERVNAVRDLFRQYGADDLASASDDVMRDLLSKRAGDVSKWTAAKNDVIEKLSFPLMTQSDDVARAAQKGITGGAQKALPAGAQAIGANLPATQVNGALTDMFWKSGKGLPGAGSAQTTAAQSAAAIAARIVPMTNTLSKIDDSLAFLEQLKTNQVKPVVAILNDWRSAIQGQDLRNIELLRKQIGEAFKAPELASVRSTGERILSDIYGAVKDDMTAYIQKAGGTADLNKWQVANKELSKMMGELELPALKAALDRGDATPEVINTMLFSRKKSDVEALYRNLTPDGRASARTAIIAKAAEKSGDLATLSPDRFVSEIKKLGNQVGVFFTGDDLKQLQGLVRVLDATKHAAVATAMPSTGVQAVIPASAAALGSFFGKGINGFIATMGIGAGIGGAARLYESKPVRDLLMKLPTVKVGSKEEAALFKRLLETVQAQKE